MKYTKEEQAENRKKWVEALRSGAYEQTTGALRIGDSFCCLGVACDISGLGQWIEKSRAFGVNRYLGAEGHLPMAVQHWLGLRTGFGDYAKGPHVTYDSLADGNDSGFTFKEIADIIDSEPEGLIVQ